VTGDGGSNEGTKKLEREQKSNKESKKPKATSDGTKKQKKDSQKHDGSVADLFKSSDDKHNIKH